MEKNVSTSKQVEEKEALKKVKVQRRKRLRTSRRISLGMEREMD